MSVVDFEVHLDQSENIELAGTAPGEELKTINRLEPFETKEVARVILKNNWKLKSKFKLTMNIPEKETQMQFIKDDEFKLKRHIQEARDYLSNIPIDTMAREDIERELEKYKLRFLDLDFLPNDDAMVNNRFMENMKDLLDYVVHWRRPEEFCLADGYNDEIKVFSYKDPEPNDIQQVLFNVIKGILSDNYFASALSALAERYNLVKRLFRNENFSKFGIYQVKLCISGEWTCVTIDDYFPCIPQSNPLVSRSPDNELWVLILEKVLF
jgi:calpain-15